MIIAVVALIRYAKVVPALSGLTLEPPTAEDVAPTATLLSNEHLHADASEISLPEVGSVGLSESVLRPAGKARFGDRMIDVLSEGEFIEPNQSVVVVKRQAQVVVVRKV